MEILDSSIFDLSPIPFWLEDFSEVKNQFDIWKNDGVENLEDFLREDMSRVLHCANLIKVLKVNHKTLELFEAKNVDHLRENLSQIFSNDMAESHIHDLLALWNNQAHFSNTAVNYSLTGKRLDIHLRGTVLPGHEDNLSLILLSTENITSYQDACRLEAHSRSIAEARFTYSPTSLWVEDFSRIKTRLDHLKAIGIEDFVTFLDVHNDFIIECLRDISIIDVNQATLNLFGASSKDHLLQNIYTVFGHETLNTFRGQLIELWKGNIHHQCEAVNYALDGSIRHVLLQFTIFPGFEDNWSMAQLALTDITARKKAENYLEYLGKHDVLTKLYNRSFYSSEINRIERSTLRPVSCIYIDMNGLKEINDTQGHDVGDDLLRRTGAILTQLIHNTLYSASRIGGDEFVVLLPGADEAALQSSLDALHELIHIDNQFYSTQKINFAIGSASSQNNERIEDMLKRADKAMYLQKRAFYLSLKHEKESV
ncbi:histidine kinase [Acinetobacter sp. Ac_877]|uniref:sensor domain-containing diguanylate cyclase n=1 Tax=Acinetobacter portensis TaxID=1839785 RepID=UPI00128E0393|nr:sensor domain-containing diguanylate cyclase [Acinetobacter portensis]MPW42281.1 histidine kinase [Acinetobacter portensis]